MTDSSKVQALTALLEQVIFSLNMTQYSIDDPTAAHKVESDADEYFQQMVAILHSDSGEAPGSSLEP